MPSRPAPSLPGRSGPEVCNGQPSVPSPHPAQVMHFASPNVQFDFWAEADRTADASCRSSLVYRACQGAPRAYDRIFLLAVPIKCDCTPDHPTFGIRTNRLHSIQGFGLLQFLVGELLYAANLKHAALREPEVSSARTW